MLPAPTLGIDPWVAGVGYCAALTFGIVNGAAAILINTHLREESMVAMTLLQMVSQGAGLMGVR